MDAPLQHLPVARFSSSTSLDQPELPTLSSLGLSPNVKARVKAGERAAHQTLESFLRERAMGYRKAISSPLSAQDSCSRLSSHLAFGTVSMRTVHQATEAARSNAPDRGMAYALTGFAGRLRWHCHFMQKLESEPAIEFHNFARAYDGLRESEFNEAYFDAWRLGMTGYPMVDACMRSLVATGWLNFRMRAMLVSFASYHLWLHWRQTGLFLARQFLDFEPGIHWSQMQMQSGTTGINTLRIYSPVKQARDQDPQGIFIRQWVPELARVPLPYLPEPWKMDISVQRMAGCLIGQDYPVPIVDDKTAVQAAKLRMYGLRAHDDSRAEARAVQQRHGSRKSGLPPSGQARSANPKRPKTAASATDSSSQGNLFS
jgi:deoxyribodipyrimidine photo-lyase